MLSITLYALANAYTDYNVCFVAKKVKKDFLVL